MNLILRVLLERIVRRSSKTIYIEKDYIETKPIYRITKTYRD